MGSQLFDFDELEELEEAAASRGAASGQAAKSAVPDNPAPEAAPPPLGSPCPTPAGPSEGGSECGDSWGEDSDDGVSEVWPDDVPHEPPESETTEPEPERSPPAPRQQPPTQANVTNGAEEADTTSPWEVVFSRVVIRAAPHFDAPVVGICSRSELVFETPGCSDPNWVRLFGGRGFILKDGRAKDPKLGLLLKPFNFPAESAVPSECQQHVFRALRDAWVEAQAHSNFLKAPEIRRLRKAADDAIAKAGGPGNSFDTRLFEDTLASEAKRCSTEQFASNGVSGAPTVAGRGRGRGKGGLLAAAAGLGSQVALAPRILGGFGAGMPVGVKFWDYTAPRLQRAGAGGSVTAAYVRMLLDSMRRRCLPCAEDVASILRQAATLCGSLPSLVELQVPPSATLHVVGDLHGQYWDLLQVLEASGDPSPSNLYVFNGDLVDRGEFSVEVTIAVLALKLALPDCVHVNRGNHEAARMNAIFGFQAEAKLKYSEDILALFSEAFCCLPVATLVNDSVFIVHGGLSSRRSLRLGEVAALQRRREPEDADQLMVELLWSDPTDQPGQHPSPRGGGILFGPDVTRRFCEDNDLLCIIRSHEMKTDGFEWHHDRRCITIFSAANYCGVCGNLGAVCDIVVPSGSPELQLEDLRIRTFEASEHPNEKPPQPRFGFFY